MANTIQAEKARWVILEMPVFNKKGFRRTPHQYRYHIEKLDVEDYVIVSPNHARDLAFAACDSKLVRDADNIVTSDGIIIKSHYVELGYSPISKVVELRGRLLSMMATLLHERE